MTYTVAKLPVSHTTFCEIVQKLKEAGYEHAFKDGFIDMHGIALAEECGAIHAVKDIYKDTETLCGVKTHEFEINEKGYGAGPVVTANMGNVSCLECLKLT